MGWQYPVKPRPWDEIDARFTDLAMVNPPFEHIAAIVRSVRAMRAERDLAAFTSLHDLMVVSEPIPDPPVELVAVRAPGSVANVSDECVLIEHLSVTGRNDQIERPVAEAVSLFWRFMIEKFGVDPRNYSQAH
jgi:hypothetical protein